MKETGEIIGIGKGRATVRVNRRSACGSCRACGMKPEEPHIDFDVPVGEGLKAGDRVEIEIPEGGVAKMSLAAYALPPTVRSGAATRISSRPKLLKR